MKLDKFIKIYERDHDHHQDLIEQLQSAMWQQKNDEDKIRLDLSMLSHFVEKLLNRVSELEQNQK